MASEFIGSTVRITVQTPPGAQLKGLVQDIQGRVLFLKDGKGQRSFLKHH